MKYIPIILISICLFFAGTSIYKLVTMDSAEEAFNKKWAENISELSLINTWSHDGNSATRIMAAKLYLKENSVHKHINCFERLQLQEDAKRVIKSNGTIHID